MAKIAVLYHADADGFGAAYACWKAFDSDEQIVYLPVQYGQPVPELPETVEELFIVDFSYSREICEELAAKYKVTILDHHKTAEAALAGLPYAIYDMNRSGAVMAWEHFFNGDYETDLPVILQYVQDRDLWRFQLPHSEEVNLFIATLDNDFAVWDKFNLREAIASGIAIKAFRDMQIKRAVKNAWLTDFMGHVVPMVNLAENVSEVGNKLCEAYPEALFSVTYCDRADGKRSYSLRSIGDTDVSTIAKMLGGGGHKNAAGFSVALEAGK
jgi:oligoribonuclease NrnB/cAMP/cGMP phosphodiesterase (DHH superfamily)